jgi:hypothetical protein
VLGLRHAHGLGLGPLPVLVVGLVGLVVRPHSVLLLRPERVLVLGSKPLCVLGSGRWAEPATIGR